ncbi:MAG TPA: hypothetical protein VL383_03105 [Gemmatimonadaceae bacterium]|jgi:hypothetical protein|nr:hypothetical protein [Gemmatimonadaceae bacterium]
MKERDWYTLAAVVALCATGIGALRWRNTVLTASVDPVAIPARGNSDVHLDEALLRDAADLIVSNDPFRLTNSPPLVRYDPKTESSAPPTSVAPAPIRPVMTLKAIVGGPPWQAIVDGLPGQPPGTVVHAGSAFDKLVARAVTRDSVVIQGPDTTWVLSFRRRE